MMFAINPNSMIQLGNIPNAVNGRGAGTKALSTTSDYFAIGFHALDTTLTSVQAYISALSASPLADQTCEIWSDVNGVPGSLITNGTSSTVSGFAAAGIITFAGFSCTLTKGLRYWAVCKTAAGNYPTYKYGSVIITNWGLVSVTGYLVGLAAAVYNGSAWSLGVLSGGFAVQFGNGSIVGDMMDLSAGVVLNPLNTNTETQGFTAISPDINLYVYGIGASALVKAGTPGDLIAALKVGRNGGVLRSVNLPHTVITTGYTVIQAIFDEPVLLPRNTQFSADLTTTTADGTNRYTHGYESYSTAATHQKLHLLRNIEGYLGASSAPTFYTSIRPYLWLNCVATNPEQINRRTSTGR